MAMSKLLAACLMLASQTYQVPPAVMVGIWQVEGGKVGMESPNTNGTHDLGPMQINTIWIPELAEKWGVGEDTARRWIRDDPCTNMGVAAWIFRSHYNETGSLAKSIQYYHSRTPKYGNKYRKKVITAMAQKGLLKGTATR